MLKNKYYLLFSVITFKISISLWLLNHPIQSHQIEKEDYLKKNHNFYKWNERIFGDNYKFFQAETLEIQYLYYYEIFSILVFFIESSNIISLKE